MTESSEQRQRDNHDSSRRALSDSQIDAAYSFEKHSQKSDEENALLEQIAANSFRPNSCDPVEYEEEYNNLLKAQGEIIPAMLMHKRRAEEYERQADTIRPIDYDDADLIKQTRRDAQRHQLLYEETTKHFEQPYFARLDLSEDDHREMHVYYIGESYIPGIAADWRAPIAQIYYAANQDAFVVEDIPYILELKRSLTINDGGLQDVATTFDSTSELFDDGLIDSFLLTVLADKRRERKATNIIRSIQASQDAIIRQDKNKNFVVQGCAGSGKTMIMLHRLSYLIFNNKTMDLSRIKVITPNADFRVYINELSESLGLHEIERYSVEEYYGHLISSYSDDIPYKTEVMSEKALDEKLMEHVYSLDFQMELQKLYHSYWTEVFSEVDIDAAKKLFGRHKAKMPDLNDHTQNTVIALSGAIRTLDASIAEIEKRRDALKADLANSQVQWQESNREFEAHNEAIEKKKGSVLEQLSTKREEAVQNVTELGITELAQKEELEEASQAKQAALDTYENLKERISAEAANESSSDLQSLLNSTDPDKAELREQARALSDRLEELQQELSGIPRYNFGKRNTMKSNIRALEEELSTFLSENIGKKREEDANMLSAAEASALEASEALDAAKASLSETEEARVAATAAVSAIDEALEALGNDDAAKPLSLYGKHALEQIDPEFARLITQVAQEGERKAKLEQEIQAISEGLARVEPLLDNDTAIIRALKDALVKLGFNRLYVNTFTRALQSTYREFGQVYTKNNYRHKLYLRLLCVSLYFNYLKSPDLFLNVDEAQDLSIAEYELLGLILGNDCVFNLYGDVNQAVYSYKGVSDWSDIFCIEDDDDVFILENNYRNTLQITEYCNEMFDAEMVPIGITGADVLEMSTEDAVEWALDLHDAKPEYRIAIIYRYGMVAIADKLRELIGSRPVNWSTVGEAGVSIVSAETAKGLEFDAVVAITANMSFNERYVATTRAMDNLVVVNDSYEDSLVDEDTVEEASE